MKEIISFFKEIFMMNDCGNRKVGLSQFSADTTVELPQKIVAKSLKDVKLSDLMRKSA